MRPALVSALIMLAAAPLADARAQEEESFGDWKAQCAGGLCVAHTVTPGGAVTLRLLREDAPWEIAFAGIQNDIREGTAIDVSVDGSRPVRFAAGGYAVESQRVVLTEPRPARALYAMLLRGRGATLAFTHETGAPLRLTFSLNGVTAATQWIEDERERGYPPDGAPAASAEAPEPARPEPDAPTETAQPSEPPPEREAAPSADPVEVPDIVRQRHLADGECEDHDDEYMRTAQISGKLDANRTLYLLPCTSGAYNVAYRAWITDSEYPEEADRSLFAAYSDEQGWYGTDMLVNPEYDAETKMLSALEKARGVGDCGSAPTWRWGETGWQLLEYRYQDACDGTRTAENWPVIFQRPDDAAR